jgi:cytosine/uracil/thiamine/allantoin permease
MKQLARRVATIAWPAFLGAGALEMAVFAFVDPATLSLPGGQALDLSATTVYSVAFFLFWAVAAAACALTWLLARGAEEINAHPAARG